jgi:hypothetical protein
MLAYRVRGRQFGQGGPHGHQKNHFGRRRPVVAVEHRNCAALQLPGDISVAFPVVPANARAIRSEATNAGWMGNALPEPWISDAKTLS